MDDGHSFPAALHISKQDRKEFPSSKEKLCSWTGAAPCRSTQLESSVWAFFNREAMSAINCGREPVEMQGTSLFEPRSGGQDSHMHVAVLVVVAAASRLKRSVPTVFRGLTLAVIRSRRFTTVDIIANGTRHNLSPCNSSVWTDGVKPCLSQPGCWASAILQHKGVNHARERVVSGRTT